ncbi:MAG: hypothetical protein IJ637_07140 [Prevotella sp.]|nr:hypothetical protein [Prevotella sp.]
MMNTQDNSRILPCGGSAEEQIDGQGYKVGNTDATTKQSIKNIRRLPIVATGAASPSVRTFVSESPHLTCQKTRGAGVLTV